MKSGSLFFLILSFSCLSFALPKRTFIGFPQGLEVTMLHHYKASYNQHTKVSVLGFQINNMGIERELSIQLKGQINYSQTLFLAAHDERQFFVYLPNNTKNNFSSNIVFTDSLTGDVHQKRFYESFPRQNNSFIRLAGLQAGVTVSSLLTDLGSVEIQHIPDEWLGMTGISVIAADYSQFYQQPEWIEKFKYWLAMGGILYIADDGLQKMPWTPKQLPFATLTSSRLLTVGNGAIVLIDAKYLSKIATKKVTRFHYKNYQNDNKITNSPSQLDAFFIQNLGHIGASKRWLFSLLLIVFTLIVGVFAWLYFIKRKAQPFRYIAFVIVTSLCTSMGIFITNIIAEGTTPKLIQHSIKLIDFISNTEITYHEEALFRPTGLYGSDIALKDNRLLGFNTVSSASTGNQQTSLSLDVNGHWKYSGALPVRQRLILLSYQISKTQGKLFLRSEGTQLILENHLGVHLSTLYIRHKGECYQLQKLLSGQRKALSKMGCKPLRYHQFSHYGQELKPLVDHILKSAKTKNIFFSQYQDLTPQALVKGRVRFIKPSKQTMVGFL